MLPLIPAPETPLSQIRALLCNAVASQHTKRAYGHAIDGFLCWCHSSGAGAFTKATVQEYRSILYARGLSPSTISVQTCAIRKLAAELADNGLLSLDAAAGIAKVKGTRGKGVRLGNWLSTSEAEELIMAPNGETLKGKRDRALLSVLLGAGLRRSEASALLFSHVQQRDGRWAIVDLLGKHRRIRTIPLPSWAKAAIDLWAQAAGIDAGGIFRRLNKRGRIIGTSITPQSVYQIVKGYASEIHSGLAPHDCRRTFARLARNGNSPLEQIQLSLGHASVVTTELYLGVRQDLNDAPCDRLGLHFDPRSNDRSATSLDGAAE